jgi:hypothetical protein
VNEEDFKAFLAAIERFDAKHTMSPEAARKILQQEGVLTETGEIAEPYAPVRASDAG